VSPAGAPTLERPLSGSEFVRLQRLARLRRAWTRTARARRLLFLALAAPGFFAVFATPLHHQLIVLVVGLGLFAGACLFRARTEPLFQRAEAAALWPPPAARHLSEKPHA
jgi:hypothetical protein